MVFFLGFDLSSELAGQSDSALVHAATGAVDCTVAACARRLMRLLKIVHFCLCL